MGSDPIHRGLDTLIFIVLDRILIVALLFGFGFYGGGIDDLAVVLHVPWHGADQILSTSNAAASACGGRIEVLLDSDYGFSFLDHAGRFAEFLQDSSRRNSGSKKKVGLNLEGGAQSLAEVFALLALYENAIAVVIVLDDYANGLASLDVNDVLLHFHEREIVKHSDLILGAAAHPEVVAFVGPVMVWIFEGFTTGVELDDVVARCFTHEGIVTQERLEINEKLSRLPKFTGRVDELV